MRVIASRQSKVTHLDNAAHHGGRRPASDITMIVMHATADDSTGMASIHYLNTTKEKDASYHFVIERDGRILRMAPVNLVAWHAGDSAWPCPVKYPPGNKGHSVNKCSIGISWANDDVGEELTDEQIESGLWLCHVMMEQLGIPSSRVVGHYEVSPGRKPDPRKAMSMREWRQMLEDTRL